MQTVGLCCHAFPRRIPMHARLALESRCNSAASLALLPITRCYVHEPLCVSSMTAPFSTQIVDSDFRGSCLFKCQQLALQINQRLLTPLHEALPGTVEIYDYGKYHGDHERQHGRGEDLPPALEAESISHQD